MVPLDKVDEVERKLIAQGYEPCVVPISNNRAVISWLRSLDGRINYTNVKFGNDLLMKEINIGTDNALKVGFSYFNDSTKLTKDESSLVANIIKNIVIPIPHHATGFHI